MLRRLDNTQGALLDELRAIHALLARVLNGHFPRGGRSFWETAPIAFLHT